MLKHMKNFFSKNIGTKIAAFLIAVLLWVLVVNLQNPTTSKTFYNVPIGVLNETVFADNDEAVHVLGALTVDVTVSGKRSAIESISASEVTATIDYLSADLTTYTVPVVCNVSHRDTEVIYQSKDQLSIEIAKLESREMEIELVIEGEPQSGFVIPTDDEGIVISPKTISVKAPAEILERIDRAVVSMNAAGAHETLSGKGKSVIFLDAQGGVLNLDEERDVVLSTRLMDEIVVPVYASKLVGVTVEGVSDLAPQYATETVTTSQATLVLYGDANVLSKISAVPIQVSARDKTETFMTEIAFADIAKELSEKAGAKVGIIGDTDVLTVTVVLKEKTPVDVITEASQYEISGLGEGWETELVAYPEEFTILTDPSVSVGELKFDVDASSCTEEGTYDVSFAVRTPNGATLADPTLTVTISVWYAGE